MLTSESRPGMAGEHVRSTAHADRGGKECPAPSGTGPRPSHMRIPQPAHRGHSLRGLRAAGLASTFVRSRDAVYTRMLRLHLWLWPTLGVAPEEPRRAAGWPERMAVAGYWLALAGTTLLMFALRRQR